MNAKNLYKKIFFFLFIYATSFGCQTFDTFDTFKKVELPPSLSSHFTSCSLPADGGLLVKKAKNNYAADLDWVVDSDKGLNVEMSDALGRVLVGIFFSKDLIYTTGSFKDDLGTLTKNKEGFLLWNDYFTGLKIEELSCLVKFKLPSEWNDSLRGVKKERNSYQLVYSQEHRRIQVSLDESSLCTTISWSVFLGIFKKELKWCYTLGKNNSSGEIELPEDETLIWQQKLYE